MKYNFKSRMNRLIIGICASISLHDLIKCIEECHVSGSISNNISFLQTLEVGFSFKF